MKRTILTTVSALAMLVAAPALAQNNQSTVNQSGADAGGNGAAAYVNQNGSNAVSTVEQQAAGTANVTQNGTRGSTSQISTLADDRFGENTVTVNQSDNGNAPTAAGGANYSRVVQDNVNGAGSTDGNGTTANVTQIHDSSVYGRNYSNVVQGRNASDGDVIVRQEGGDNISEYSANTSSNNDANVNQTGAENTSQVVQNFQAGGAYAGVQQSNLAPNGNRNSAYVEQVSDGFSAAPPEFAMGAEAYVFQTGNGQMAYVSQTGYSETDASSNFARTEQNGSDHDSWTTQSGINNDAYTLQNGSGNSSNINQSGDNNYASANQSDSSNVSTILQSGNGNNAQLTQTGSGNNSNITQSGPAGVAIVNQ